MMLLAVIIAQPLNYDALSFTVNTHLEKHKIKERVKLYSLTNKHLIQSEVNNQNEFNVKIKSTLYNDESIKLKRYLSSVDSKINNDKVFIDLVSKKIIQLNKICLLYTSRCV